MRTFHLLLLAALLPGLPATVRADWMVSADPAAMRGLPLQWQQYFGIHYGTVAGYDGPGFKTVRSYGAPNLGLPRNADGTLNTNALTGTCRAGPFSNEVHCVGPQDIRNYNTGSAGLDTFIPELSANGLTAIYPTPNLFFPPQPLNQDLACVTLRSVYEAFPSASSNVLWQWGNEVNGKNWNPSLTNDPPANQSNQIPFYAGAYFARGIETLYRVAQDLYGDPQRLKVVTGSFANIYNVNYRNWMRGVLNYEITGTYAPTLAGSAIWQHVDSLTVHYPFTAGEGGGAVMQELWDEWIASGKIPSLWVTEDHGNAGGGPSTILARSMRYLDWIASVGADANQTRLCWWGTGDNDPGGQAIEAINLLGQLHAGTNLRQQAFSLDGAEIYLVGNGDSGSFTRLTVAIIPSGAEEPGQLPISTVDPGDSTLTLPAGGLANVGPATGVQYSRDVPSQTWTPTVTVSGQTIQIPVGRAISSPVLITLPLAFSVPVPPRLTALAKIANGIQLDWRSVPNQTYQVEYSADLAAWSNAGPAIVAIALQTSWTDDGTLTGGTATKRFYRVRVP